MELDLHSEDSGAERGSLTCGEGVTQHTAATMTLAARLGVQAPKKEVAMMRSWWPARTPSSSSGQPQGPACGEKVQMVHSSRTEQSAARNDCIPQGPWRLIERRREG